MPTTGGALAFEGFVPPYEATLTQNLREAGAIIIAKTVLTELANWVAGAPTPMPANYSALGGYGINPYDPRRDPREGTDDGRPALAHRRIELGHRHRRQLLGGQCRHRDRRARSSARRTRHAGRHQADGRAHQPLRHHPDHRRSGHGRPDGADGDRCGDPARRARGRVARSERPGDEPLHAAAESRLHAAPQAPTASRARASAFRARSSTTRSTPPGETAPRGGLNDGPGQGDGRRHRRSCDAQGAVDRRSGRHPERRRPRSGRATSCCGTSARASTTPRARTRPARSCFKYGMKRDFNAWLALARPRGAGEDADRAARAQPGAHPHAAPSSTARRSSTSRTRWIWRPTARATRPTAPRTSRSAARTASTR